MATTSDLTRRIDTDLWAIDAEANFLPELADGWDDETPVSRDVWYFEWRDLMGRLASLDREYRSGTMGPDQQARYRNLLRKLEGALPILRQLDLPLPSVSLEA